MIYIIIGFFAELIDGIIGMAYGVICRTFLVLLGQLPPSSISTIIHIAELPASLSAFITHLKFKNINKKVMIKLSIAGIIGAIIGSKINLSSNKLFEPIICIFMLFVGFAILRKYFKTDYTNKIKTNYFILGIFGAICDVIGGGGYGPIVTGSIMIKHNDMSKIIGTVNSSEFFVVLTSSFILGIFTVDIYSNFKAILGLVIGGIIAAPIAARINIENTNRKMYLVVGTVLVLLNGYNLLLFFL